MPLINRRAFLQASLSFVLLPCCSWQFPIAAASGSRYYTARQPQLLAEFQGVLQGAQAMLTPEIGSSRAQSIVQDAADRFKELLPELPEVGGEQNVNVDLIPVAAWYASLYPAMQAQELPAERTGKLIYDLNQFSYAKQPLAALQAEGDALFSPASLQRWRQWALASQQREFSANWVAAFIESDGETFDFGIEYSECAIVKYLHSQNAAEVAPYVCINDFLKSKVIGSGLERTKTIAAGDGYCSFRYKKDRPVTQDWETEIARLKNKS